MKPDLIVAHPLHLDYPLFRHQIRKYRNRFEKVIIVFTQMNAGHDYSGFVKDSMNEDHVTFINSFRVDGNEDWRDVAVKKALNFSESSWIFFTEQDFFMKKDFWKEVDEAFSYNSDVIYANQDGRMHPCCIFIKRGVLEKTSKNFGVVRDISDHFGLLQKEIREAEPPFMVFTIQPKAYKHLNALSQNMYMLQTGQKPNYQEGEFKKYLSKCLKLSIPLHPDFVELASHYLND